MGLFRKNVILVRKDNNEVLCKHVEFSMYGKYLRGNYYTKSFYSKNGIKNYHHSEVPYERCGTNTEDVIVFHFKHNAKKFLKENIKNADDFYVTRINKLNLVNKIKVTINN